MNFEWQYFLDLRPSWVHQDQARRWEEAVRRIIVKISKSEAGRALLNSIKFYGKWIPITHYDNTQGTCNAYATVKTGAAKDGRQYGSAVFFSPHIFQVHGACHSAQAEHNRGGNPDEILYHELVHAFRRTSSKRARVETSGGLINYDSNEEFIAILITNIYVSDTTNKVKTGLRRDHHASDPLEANLASSFAFFASSMDTFDMVDKLCKDHPGLTGALAKVKAPFNPLAAYYKDQAKARAQSRTALAVVRDGVGWGIAIRDWVGSHL